MEIQKSIFKSDVIYEQPLKYKLKNHQQLNAIHASITAQILRFKNK
jgi:hypothetical protein